MSLTLVIGYMFSGKSSYLLSCIRRYKEIDFPIYIITSILDKRYSDKTIIINHNKESFVADIAIDDLSYVPLDEKFMKAKVIIIEEGQFYKNLLTFVTMLVDHYGKKVIVAGLDGDANRKMFGDILKLIPLSDSIIKLKSYCKKCNDGTEALFTSKNTDKIELIDIGGSDKYEALCRKHYIENNII